MRTTITKILLLAACSTAGAQQFNPTQIVPALGYSAGYEQYGDSKPCYTGAAPTTVGNVYRSAQQNGFVELLHGIFGGDSSNNCVSGDTSIDTNYYVFNHLDNEGVGSPSYGLEYFTNDANTTNGAAVGYQNSVRYSALGMQLFAAIPRAKKVFAQDAAVTTIGTWTNEVNYQYGFGMISTTNASVINIPVVVGSDGNVVLWSQINDASGGTFTVNIDSGANLTDPVTSSTTFAASGYGGLPILSPHGKSYAMLGYVFPGLTAGTHTIHVTVTSATNAANLVEIGGAAGLPVANVNLPQVFQSGVEYQNSSSGGAADSLTATYDGIASSVTALTAGLGLNTNFVPTRTALLNDPTCGAGSESAMFTNCYADALHFKNAGHAVVANTYRTVSLSIATTKPLYAGALKNPLAGPANVYGWGPAPVDTSHWFSVNGARAGGSVSGYGVQLSCAYGGLFCSGIGALPNYGTAIVAGGGNFSVLKCLSLNCETNGTNYLQIFTTVSNGSACFFGTAGACGGSPSFYITPTILNLGGYPGYAQSGVWLSSANNGVSTATAATAGANQNSSSFRFRANYWNGAANQPSDIFLFTQIGTGATPTSTLKLGSQYNPGPIAVDFSAAGSVNMGASIPTVGTPSVNQAACIKSAGPPVVIGYCSSAVSAGGGCTCN